MSVELMLSIAAIIVSVAALGISFYLSLRQIRSMQHANHVPVAIELLLRELAKDDFQEREMLVVEQLPATDPSVGFSGLPEPLRSASYSVSSFYDSMGILVAFGFIDEALAIATINFRTRRIWRTLEAHIRQERELRGSLFLDFLEDLAARAFSKDPQELNTKLRLRTLRPSRPLAPKDKSTGTSAE